MSQPAKTLQGPTHFSTLAIDKDGYIDCSYASVSTLCPSATLLDHYAIQLLTHLP